MFVAENAIKNRDATGYNKFSGIGILMSTVKGFARTTISCYENGDKPRLAINSDADASLSINNRVGITFCRLVATSSDESIISITFGEGRPLMEQFLSSVLREYGFWKTLEGEWQELNAPVCETYSIYAPIFRDIQGAQSVKTGLGTDKDGNLVETAAPITEIIHGKAPINKDIRSPQTVTIGIGNDESGDEAEQREAAIDVTMGEKADITLASRSGVNLEFERAVSVETDDTADLESAKAMSLKTADAFSIKAGKKVKIENTAESLGAILSDFIQAVNDAVTIGSPTTQTMNPATKLALQTLKTRAQALMEQ
jgi:hypothetical protein